MNKEPLDAVYDNQTDVDRIKDVYYRHKEELINKFSLSEKQLSDYWTSFLEQIWDDTWIYEKITVGKFLDMFSCFVLDGTIPE